jgi:plastocyanin
MPSLLRPLVWTALLWWASAEGVSAGTLAVSVTDDTGKPVQGAVVFVDGPGATPVTGAPEPVALMDQVGKKFVPQVLVVPAGAEVSFPNSDNIRHHVYSFSEARSFELPLYAGTPAEPVRFPVPGVVVLGCNIHDWMRGHIVVVPGRLFAVTGADGIARIDGLPGARLRVMAWHPDLALQRAVAGGEVDGAAPSSAISIGLALKRKLQLRRAPSGRGSDPY